MIFRLILASLVLASLGQAKPAQAKLAKQKKLKVVTTTTDLQWLVQKIGGSRVKVESLLNGTEDPHFIDAMPHFVSKVAAADIFCLVGLELETGWAPGVLTRSGNKKVQKGGKGYCETGATVSALGIPVGQIDRTQGDVHPSGNPHYHLGPDAFLQGGKTVLQTLVRIDSASKSYYQNNFEKLKKELVGLKLKVAKILEPIKDQKYLEYHKEFTYFFKEFGLKNEGSIEAAPGVLPSAGRLARVSVQAANSKIALALAAKTSPKKITKKFVAMSKVPVARVPLSIVKRGKIKTYEDLLTHIAKSMVDSSGKNAKM